VVVPPSKMAQRCCTFDAHVQTKSFVHITEPRKVLSSETKLGYCTSAISVIMSNNNKSSTLVL
jgi:hypothetical protein